MPEYIYNGKRRKMRLKRKLYLLEPGEKVTLPDDFVPGRDFELVKAAADKPKKKEEGK